MLYPGGGEGESRTLRDLARRLERVTCKNYPRSTVHPISKPYGSENDDMVPILGCSLFLYNSTLSARRTRSSLTCIGMYQSIEDSLNS